MCFGVRDAIDLAIRAAQAGPLTVLGDLVHNETVLADLRRRGVQIRHDLANLGHEPVMITAHGASERRLRALRERGLTVLESTCPLVHAAHRALAGLVRSGFYPVIVGKADHVEVRGMTEDLEDFRVILAESDVDHLPERERYGVVAQTTQPIERVRHLAGCVRARFPAANVQLIDTVCQPTKLRQHAAMELAQHCDVVIVVGGAHSNNTRELVESCRRDCPRVFHVQGPDDLDPSWFVGAVNVGITAGTSTPDAMIDAVELRMEQLAGHGVAACSMNIEAARP
jgi:4-hydroxy-3-methylbut-2-enyl diphosphate reductase